MATLYHKEEIFVWFFIKSSQLFFPKIPIFFRYGHHWALCVELGNVLLAFLLYLYIPTRPQNGQFEHFIRRNANHNYRSCHWLALAP